MVETGRISAYFDSLNLYLHNDDQALRLNEAEVYRLLDVLGIDRCPAEFLGRGSSELELKNWAAKAAGLADDEGRILLKIVGRNILHKTEAGGVAVLFSRLVYAAEDFFDKLKIADYLKNPIGGLLIGIIIIFVPHVYGVGYETIDMALSGNLLWYVAVALIFI